MTTVLKAARAAIATIQRTGFEGPITVDITERVLIESGYPQGGVLEAECQPTYELSIGEPDTAYTVKSASLHACVTGVLAWLAKGGDE